MLGHSYVENDAVNSKLDASLVMQIFAPLVLSQWLLIKEAKEPCTTILCPNGYLFVFKNLEDILFVAINGDGHESETFLQRKLEVFITLMKFMFGPAFDDIGLSHSYSKEAKWDLMRNIMNHWLEMVECEQAFLVEAIERLHVNQMVSEKCIEILEKTVKQLQASRELTIHHSVLLVNSKLLALYSNRSAHELRSKDILSLTILAKTIYPYSERLEDLFSVHYIMPKSKSKPSEEDNSDGGEDEYHSAPNTPGGQRSRSPSVIVDSYYKKTSASSSKEQVGTFHSPGTPDSLFDTLPHLSTSGSGTITNFEPVDQEFSENCPSLLEMYTAKYPDSVFTKTDLDTHKSQFFKSEANVPSNETHAEVYDYPEHRKLPQISENVSSYANQNHTCQKEELVSQSGLSNQISNEQPTSSIFNNEERSPVSSSLAEHLVNSNPEKNCVVQDQLQVNETSVHFMEVQALDDILDVKSETSLRQSTASSSRCSSTGTGETSSRSFTISFEPNIDTYTPSRTSSVLSNISKSYPELSSNNGQDLTFDQTQSEEDVTDTPTPVKKIINPTKINSAPHNNQTPSVPKLTTLSNLEETLSNRSSFKNYWPYSVFLETSTCPYVPYNIHCLQVLPGVTLILLSQAQKHTLAESIYQVITNVQDLLYNKRSKFSRSRSNQVYEIINSLLSKLHNNLKKNKGIASSMSFDLHSHWEKDDLKHKLIDYLEKDQKFPISKELESHLSEIYKKLKELFSHLFLTPVQYSPQLIQALSQVSMGIGRDLLDYREYLNVKAQRNLTMTSYIDEFPGLIHFIFVDRLFHQMSAPSLNISMNSSVNIDATSYLKDKIWRMYQNIMCKLTEGYTTVLLHDGDFYFSYFLWFEDYMGNPIPVQESFKPSSKMSYPGILSGSFYRILQLHCFPHAIQNSVHCFEMFLVHLGTVHPEYISAHCKRLAHKMWEMSGEAYSSVSLL
ncbi:hybrid polyketide synthetase [Bulinus truncatus]|nr:hybrid polyketide synthetase [Bulinus truncatus]